MDVRVGDKLIMKKNHPCGSNEFAVLRIGMDFRIRCLGCGREVMVPRVKAEKNIKRIFCLTPRWRSRIVFALGGKYARKTQKG